MPRFSIDEIEYNTEDLTQNGRALYDSLQFTLLQLQKIEKELQVYKIAHGTLMAQLKLELIDKTEGQ